LLILKILEKKLAMSFQHSNSKNSQVFYRKGGMFENFLMCIGNGLKIGFGTWRTSLDENLDIYKKFYLDAKSRQIDTANLEIICTDVRPIIKSISIHEIFE
jgi:hypothetical protein